MLTITRTISEGAEKTQKSVLSVISPVSPTMKDIAKIALQAFSSDRANRNIQFIEGMFVASLLT